MILPRKNSHHNIVLELLERNKFTIMAEVGVWRANMAKYIIPRYPAIKEYWAVDPWKILGKQHGRVSKVTQQKWDHAYIKSCSIMVYYSSFRSLRLDSLIAAKLFPPGYFDLVYLDALHYYDDVRNDILAWQPKIRNGGIIAGHDWKSGQHKGHDVANAVMSIFEEKEIKVLPLGVWYVRL